MKIIQKIIGIIFLFLPLIIKAEVKEIPFTLDDRDRIIRTEQKVESLTSEMNASFEAMDNRFDQLFNYMWAIIAIFTAMMVSVFGFAFWDRRLSMAPLKREHMKVVESLRELAVHQPKLREILKNAGLL
jgi:hypothetical protein